MGKRTGRPKTGRPPKKDVPVSERMTFRLTPKEKKRLQELARDVQSDGTGEITRDVMSIIGDEYSKLQAGEISKDTFSEITSLKLYNFFQNLLGERAPEVDVKLGETRQGTFEGFQVDIVGENDSQEPKLVDRFAAKKKMDDKDT